MSSSTDSRNQIILAIFVVAIFLWIMNKKCGGTSMLEKKSMADAVEHVGDAAAGNKELDKSTEAKKPESFHVKAPGNMKNSLANGIYFKPGSDKINGFKKDKVTANLQKLLMENAYG